MKKLFAIVMALMLCVGAMSVAAFAAFDNVNSLAIVGENIPGVGAWNPADSAGQMTEVSDGIYQKSLELPAGTTMNFKVAGNGTWDDTCNFGSASIVLGQVAEMECGGGSGNMTFTASSAMTIKITVDLTGDVATILVESDSTPVPPPAPVEANYYVAGVSAICGSEWQANDAANKMTKGDNGIYTITYKNVAAGDYALKVTDGSWANSWGGNGADGNYEFNVAETSDVTVEFDAVKFTVNVIVAGKPAPTPDPDPAPAGQKYYVAGVAALCGSEWVENDEANLMTAGKNGIYSITYKNVAAGSYEFKVTDGTWDNNWGTDGNNYAFTLDSAADVTIKFDSVNRTISVDFAGKKPDPKPVDPSASYYVAGVSSICGSEWQAADAANKMTYADGIFTITYKNVAAGNYSLKVTDGTWDNSWGGNGEYGNFDFEVTAACDVTVEFNPAKQQVSVIIGDERIDGPAGTGDVSLAAVSVALLAATAGLVVVVSKKKEF